MPAQNWDWSGRIGTGLVELKLFEGSTCIEVFIPLPNVSTLNKSPLYAFYVQFNSFSVFIEEGWPDLTWGTGYDSHV